MKTCVVRSSALSYGNQCRLDAKYNEFVYVRDWTAFPHYPDHCRISDILAAVPITKFKKGELEESSLLINISDQEAGAGRLIGLRDSCVDSIGSDKTDLTNCDIMVSKLGMPRGYIYLRPQTDCPIIGSSEFIPYLFRRKGQEKFYLYLLLHPEIRKVYSCLESGKTPSHKRVNPAEFLKIKIPKVADSVIANTIPRIEQYEAEIESHAQTITPPDELINEIFAEQFGFDKKLKDHFGKGMSAGTQNSAPKGIRVSSCCAKELSKSKALRLSARANNLATRDLIGVLSQHKLIQVKDILTEDIHRGVGPDYCDDGEIPVVKTAHLRNGAVLTSEEEFVTKSFFDKKERAQVHKGDILLASTGKPSIGKIDLVEDDIEYFADGHISIIRIDEEKYSKKFFVYWFRCVLGYFQIERDYVGCTNQIELYDEQIKNFFIPDISLKRQEVIVSLVDSALKCQEKAVTQMLECRKRIDDLISECLI